MGSLVTTTTLAALRAKNTSAYSGYVYNNADSPGLIPSNYTIKSNFYLADGVTLDNAGWDRSKNLSPYRVSRESMAAYLGSSVQTPPMAVWIPWWGKNAYDHINIGYNQFASNAQAVKQVADMQARGFGACIDYYGANYDPAQTYFRDACLAANLPMMIMLDSNMSPAFDGTTATFNSIMDTINTAYFSKTNYLNVGGRPVIIDFGFERFGSVDWSAVRTHISGLSGGNPLYGVRNGYRSGFADFQYGWPDPNWTSTNNDSTYLSDFYARQVANPTKGCMGPMYKGFYDKLTVPTDDTSGNWTPGGQLRIIAQNNGQKWLDTVNAIKANGPMLGALTIWNDYEEGTEIETGVGAGAAFGAALSISGNTLSWITSGNTAAVAKYRIWASLDGNNAGQVGADIPPGFNSYDLSASGISDPGSYQIFVEVVGLPSVVSVLSNSNVFWVLSSPQPRGGGGPQDGGQQTNFVSYAGGSNFHLYAMDIKHHRN